MGLTCEMAWLLLVCFKLVSPHDFRPMMDPHNSTSAVRNLGKKFYVSVALLVEI
jgi:hypothetical protein